MLNCSDKINCGLLDCRGLTEDKGYLLPLAVGCLWMLSDAVSEVMHGLTTKDVPICSGMSTDAVVCNK